jgi:hypothetical protein
MKVEFSVLLSCLASTVSAGSFVYSFDQSDVVPLQQQRQPIKALPARKREEHADYASKNHLFPAIHPDLDRSDVANLLARKNHSLFYTQYGGTRTKLTGIRYHNTAD